MMEGEKTKSMRPYYNKFDGLISKIDKNNFEIVTFDDNVTCPIEYSPLNGLAVEG